MIACIVLHVEWTYVNQSIKERGWVMRKISAIAIVVIFVLAFYCGAQAVECIIRNYVTIVNRGRIEPKPDQPIKAEMAENPYIPHFFFFPVIIYIH